MRCELITNNYVIFNYQTSDSQGFLMSYCVLMKHLFMFVMLQGVGLGHDENVLDGVMTPGHAGILLSFLFNLALLVVHLCTSILLIPFSSI